MTDEEKPPHHHTLRERLDAAEAAADEVVADEGGQLAGEVNALLLPLEQAAAAVRAAIHPESLAEDDPSPDAAKTPTPPDHAAGG